MNRNERCSQPRLEMLENRLAPSVTLVFEGAVDLSFRLEGLAPGTERVIETHVESLSDLGHAIVTTVASVLADHVRHDNDNDDDDDGNQGHGNSGHGNYGHASNGNGNAYGHSSGRGHDRDDDDRDDDDRDDANERSPAVTRPSVTSPGAAAPTNNTGSGDSSNGTNSAGSNSATNNVADRNPIRDNGNSTTTPAAAADRGAVTSDPAAPAVDNDSPAESEADMGPREASGESAPATSPQGDATTAVAAVGAAPLTFALEATASSARTAAVAIAPASGQLPATTGTSAEAAVAVYASGALVDGTALPATAESSAGAEATVADVVNYLILVDGQNPNGTLVGADLATPTDAGFDLQALDAALAQVLAGVERVGQSVAETIGKSGWGTWLAGLFVGMMGLDLARRRALARRLRTATASLSDDPTLTWVPGMPGSFTVEDR